MGIIDRLQKYMDFRELNPNKITVDAKLSVGLIGKAIKKNSGLNSDTIEKILYTYTEINPEWFVLGTGKMLRTKNTENLIKINDKKNDKDFDRKQKIQKTLSNTEIDEYQGVLRKLKYAENIVFSNTGAPYYEEAVSAGLTLLADTPTTPSGFIDIPGVNSIAYFPVTGVSFKPIINPGDIIGVDFLDNWEVLDPDAIYYIITAHNRMIKHLMNDPDDDTQLVCISTNHKEFRIDKEDIKRIYRVVFYGRLL